MNELLNRVDGLEGVAVSGRPPAPTRAQRLARDAADAAEVRRWQDHPDVIALRVERVRTQVDRLCWAGIMLGLAFTMANVQWFAAAGSVPWSLPWLAAWLLDPTVSLVLLAILRAEQVTARYQVHTGRWVRAAKWLALGATYVMNTWASFAAGSLSGVVLHSVPPLIVFAAAEAITDLRDKLTEAMNVAFTHATEQAEPRDAYEDVHGSKPSKPRATRRATSARRKLFADYLGDAKQAWTPDVVVTPAWIREVTGCSRGLSPRLATALADELGNTPDTAPHGEEDQS
ncbi:hypothetical protein [Amycolatopsis sp. NPDC021455]|uniref:hypothetical protein n=1 Tax=Amycolatopsis sp. NPDC021455 TaxID=3154901 RepID=UPI003410B68E